jgi:predicted Zn-dependent protease
VWFITIRFLKQIRASILTGAISIVLLALAPAARAHPDLLMQIEALDVEIEAQPGNADLLIRRGDLYRRHLDYPASARDFATARQADPSNTSLDFYEGRLLLDRGDAEDSEALLSRYLERHPKHALAWVLRGKANIRMQAPEAAAGYFAKAIEVSDRPSPELYRLNVLALVAAGDSKLTKARSVVDSGLQRFALEVTLLGLGTDIALAQNQPEAAQRYMNVLPQALRNLPQWQERLKLADCLATAETADRAACLGTAQDKMARQVEAIMPAS